MRLLPISPAGWGHPALQGNKNYYPVGAGHAPPAVLRQYQFYGCSVGAAYMPPAAAILTNRPAGKTALHTKTGRIAPNSALFLAKTGQLVHNRQVSAERRKSVKKFCKNAKKHLQFVRYRAIIFLGCERLVQIVTSVLRKPRYALMREVAAVKPKGWRVFPRSMSDLRTGRKNYGNKGICTPLHSAVRTNVHLTL